VAALPSTITVRGKIQVREGRFVGERGRGQLLRREPMVNCRND
jgi:dihydropyrimidinase